MKHLQPITAARNPAPAATAAQCGKLGGKIWAYGVEGPGMWAGVPFLYRYEKSGCDAIIG